MKKLSLLLFFTFSYFVVFSQWKKVDTSVTFKPEHAAEYPGGVAALEKFIGDRIQTRKKAKVTVRFIVRKNSMLTDIQTKKNGELEQEAIKIFSSMRGWVPARNGNKTVDSYVEYVVDFDRPEYKEPEAIFLVVESMPEYPGGEAALYAFLAKNTNVPQKAVDSNVYKTVRVKVVVRRDGSLTNAEVKKPVGYGMDEEAIRVISLMPKWKPGRNNGRVVDTYYSIPVEFKKVN